MEYIELVGVAAFAVSGAMAATDKHADIFGVLFLAVITALGGGVLRDMLLGLLPPRMFTSYIYVAVAMAAALIVFLEAYIKKDKFLARREKLTAMVNVFDALGLAAFTVSGADIAIVEQGISNPLLAVFMGMTTGVGGGMIRDVLLGEMSAVLRKRIYAVAAIAGALIYYFLLLFNCGELLSATVSMVLVFTLRMLATHYKWNLPRT